MIGIGIIGCGHWGPNHLRNFNGHQKADVIAFADKSLERRLEMSRLFPDIYAESDYRALLNNKDISAIVVSTPTMSHYEIVKECLINGKDVLCEKPLTIHGEHAKELVKIASQSGRILMVGHTFLYNNGIQAVKKIISDGEIGKPLYIHLRRTNLGPIRSDVNVVYDLASHDIYIANYLLGGMPDCVSATGSVYLQSGVEDVAFITMKYPANQMAHIHVSWLDPKKERQITVVGESKMIVWDDLSPETIKIYDKSVAVSNSDYDSFGQFQLILKEGDVIIPRIKLKEPLSNQTDHFLECVEKRMTPKSSGEDGVNVVLCLQAVQNSLEKMEWRKLN